MTALEFVVLVWFTVVFGGICACGAVPEASLPLYNAFLPLCGGNESAAEETTLWALSRAAAAVGESSDSVLPRCSAVETSVSWTVRSKAPNTGSHRTLEGVINAKNGAEVPSYVLFYVSDKTAFFDVYLSALLNVDIRLDVRADDGKLEQDLEVPSWSKDAHPAIAVVEPRPQHSPLTAVDVHLRYQPPREGGGLSSGTNAIPAAFLYSPCMNEADQKTFVLVKPDNHDGPLLIDAEVPLGDMLHRKFVLPITFIVAVLGALAVVLSVCL